MLADYIVLSCLLKPPLKLLKPLRLLKPLKLLSSSWKPEGKKVSFATPTPFGGRLKPFEALKAAIEAAGRSSCLELTVEALEAPVA